MNKAALAILAATTINAALIFVPRGIPLEAAINDKPRINCAVAHAAVDALLLDNNSGGITPAKLRAAIHAVAGCN